METLTLTLKSKQFDQHEVENTTTGFVLNYNGKTHVITVHHFLPIDQVYDESDNQLDISINSSWSEGLILSTSDMNLSKYRIFSKLHNNLPKINSRLSMKMGDTRIEFETNGYELMPFDNLQMDVPTLLIRSRIISDNIELASFSGSPVFVKDKIVGVFSKVRTDSNIAYIIPIYIITKNLEKEDNSNIYTVKEKHIKKIGSWIVNKDNEVYHPTLKYNIPIATFFLLEGDLNFKTIIYFGKKNTSVDLIQTIVKKDLISDSDNSIVSRNDCEYKLNVRLLRHLKDIKIDMRPLIMAITQKKRETWIRLNEDKKITLVSN
jgi:hypothetical protein